MFDWVLNTPLQLTIKTPEQHSCCSDVFIVEFDLIIVDFINFMHFSSIFHTLLIYILHIDASIVDSKQVK